MWHQGRRPARRVLLITTALVSLLCFLQSKARFVVYCPCHPPFCSKTHLRDAVGTQLRGQRWRNPSELQSLMCENRHRFLRYRPRIFAIVGTQNEVNAGKHNKNMRCRSLSGILQRSVSLNLMHFNETEFDKKTVLGREPSLTWCCAMCEF